MIGALPTKLDVNGTFYNIRSDYRDALLIMQVFQDDELEQIDKIVLTIDILYKEEIKPDDIMEAFRQALWFLNRGEANKEHNVKKPVLYNWEKDEQIIFPAINRVAGTEVRAMNHVHWWTFLGYFNEIGEGTFATITGIRSKKARGIKLEGWEREFYTNNKDMIDLPIKRTAEEQAQIDALNELLNQL